MGAKIDTVYLTIIMFDMNGVPSNHYINILPKFHNSSAFDHILKAEQWGLWRLLTHLVIDHISASKQVTVWSAAYNVILLEF